MKHDRKSTNSGELRTQFEQLDLDARKHLQGDPVKAKAIAQEAAEIAERLGLTSGVQWVFHVLGSVARNSSDFETAEAFFQKCLRHSLADSDWACLYLSKRELAIIQYFSGNERAALQLIEEAIGLVEQNNFPYLETQIVKGQILSEFERFNEALEYFLHILPRAQSNGWANDEALCYKCIAGIYGKLGDIENTRKYTQKALKIFREIDNTFGIMTCLMYLGNCYTLEHKYSNSIKHFQQALEIAHARELPNYISFCLFNIGKCNINLGRKTVGLNHMRQALANLRNGDDILMLSDCLNMLSDELIKLNEFDAAEKYCRELLELGKRTGRKHILWNGHYGLSEIYTARGESAKALQHHKQYISNYEQYIGVHVQQQIARIMARYEQREAQTTARLLHLKADELTKESELKNRELNNLALNLLQKHQGLLRLREELEELLQSAKGKALGLTHELLQNVSANIDDVQEWDRFEQQFQSIHRDFAASLAEHYPIISPMEAKVCTLLRTDLITKEIADVLCVSVHTVNTHRQRIRKKLGLTRNENLVNFLKRI